jgi:xylan 1,4-beta-xylosidase
VSFSPSGNFSYATSFPQPILMSAAFDDSLIESIAQIVSTEARAFNNFDHAGLDYWTPNINPFRDPRWGRGQETPGEDPFRIQGYIKGLIKGLQGLDTSSPYLKIVATCKHYSGYDIETNRMSFNAVITEQDLVEYFLPPFQACVRDAGVETIMCSYNAVNGIPSCADAFMLTNITRDLWGLPGWIVSDCDAVDNIFNDHHYGATFPQAAADALLAGTDLDCGTTYQSQLPLALNQSLITVKDLQTALIRQYFTLVRLVFLYHFFLSGSLSLLCYFYSLGYFDPPSSQPYRQLDWSNVGTPPAQSLAHTAAVESIVLLKNTKNILPLSTSTKIALIGPWGNATNQMQGNYAGTAPFLISPFMGLKTAGFNVMFVPGTGISSNVTNSSQGFNAALAAAQAADVVIFAGGIDNSIEAEGHDRVTITWPDNQLALINALEGVGKPVVVVQFGGGQVDSSALKNSSAVSCLLRSHGLALMHLLY